MEQKKQSEKDDDDEDEEVTVARPDVGKMSHYRPQSDNLPPPTEDVQADKIFVPPILNELIAALPTWPKHVPAPDPYICLQGFGDDLRLPHVDPATLGNFPPPWAERGKEKKEKVVKKKKELDEWDDEFFQPFNQFYSSVNTVYRQRLMIKRKRIQQGIGITQVDLTQEVS